MGMSASRTLHLTHSEVDPAPAADPRTLTVAARFRDGLRVTTSNSIGFPPFRDPGLGYPKGIISDHHQFVGTRKGAPTNWAGTPDAVDLDLQVRLAKGNLRRFTPKTACGTLSGRWRSRTGSESRL